MNYKEKLGIPKQIRNLKHSCIIDPKSKPLGFLNTKTNTVDGEIFGKYIGQGASKLVFLNKEDSSKVLKVHLKATFLNIYTMQKGVNRYLKRNKLPFFISVSYKGYVVDESNVHYPVWEQELVYDFVSEQDWNANDIITYFQEHNYLLHKYASYKDLSFYNKYYRKMSICDVRVSNIIKKDNQYYLIDFTLVINSKLGDLV